MQMSLKGSPISLCQLMGLTEQNTTTCREVRRPGARSPLLQFATGSSLSGKEAKSSLPSLAFHSLTSAYFPAALRIG